MLVAWDIADIPQLCSGSILRTELTLWYHRHRVSLLVPEAVITDDPRHSKLLQAYDRFYIPFHVMKFYPMNSELYL
jgi:hypothetical protein